MTAAAVVERLAGLLQSILLARVLGPTEFGAYGLLLSTVGMVASFAGLQMGMTATVHVARHRLSDPTRAAGHRTRSASNAPSSSRDFTVTRNRAASAPSTSRWS